MYNNLHMALYSEVNHDILCEVSMYVSMEALQGWEMGRASLSVCLQHLSYTLGCTSLHPGSPAEARKGSHGAGEGEEGAELVETATLFK